VLALLRLAQPITGQDVIMVQITMLVQRLCVMAKIMIVMEQQMKIFQCQDLMALSITVLVRPAV
jgi:hypothetical protein